MENLDKLVDHSFRDWLGAEPPRGNYLCSNSDIASLFIDLPDNLDFVRFQPKEIITREIEVNENLLKFLESNGEVQFDFTAKYNIKGKYSYYTTNDGLEFVSELKIFPLEYFGFISSSGIICPDDDVSIHKDSIRQENRFCAKIN